MKDGFFSGVKNLNQEIPRWYHVSPWIFHSRGPEQFFTYIVYVGTLQNV